MEKTLNLYVLGDKLGRLDTYVSEKAKISRAIAKKLIEDGFVKYNENQTPRPGTRIKEGDTIFIRMPIAKKSTIEKQDLPIEILFEDENIMVLNKERGMVVHPAPGNKDGTLVNALLYHVKDIQGIGNEERPGIVHRLDKNTSGVLIIAKSQKAHQTLVEMFQSRKVHKEYIAVVYGRIKGREGIINLPIGRDPKNRQRMAVVNNGKKATTRWKLKKMFKNHSLISAFPETGRTHQIRVHLKYLNYPIVGDPEYSNGKVVPTDIKGQALHAHKIMFPHPITNEHLEFTAPIPKDMEELIEKIESN